MLAMGKPEMQTFGSWAGQAGYLGLGTQPQVPGLATGNPEVEAIGS